jgi:hypothetical protein
MRDLIKITSRAAAAVFTSPQGGRIMQMLIGEQFTLANLARATEMPLSLLHYHVAKCIRLGLLKVERVEPRAGRAVKHYRATARTFFVPSELVDTLPGAELTKALRAELDRNQARSIVGVNFTHDGARPSVRMVKEGATPEHEVELWLSIGLSNADAGALIDDLKSVLDKYRERGDERAPFYLVHMAAVRSSAVS